MIFLFFSLKTTNNGFFHHHMHDSGRRTVRTMDYREVEKPSQTPKSFPLIFLGYYQLIIALCFKAKRKIRNKKTSFTLSIPIQYSTWVLSWSNKTTGNFQGIQIVKEKVKASLLEEDMIIYISEPKIFPQETPTVDKSFQQCSWI